MNTTITTAQFNPFNRQESHRLTEREGAGLHLPVFEDLVPSGRDSAPLSLRYRSPHPLTYIVRFEFRQLYAEFLLPLLPSSPPPATAASATSNYLLTNFSLVEKHFFFAFALSRRPKVTDQEM